MLSRSIAAEDYRGRPAAAEDWIFSHADLAGLGLIVAALLVRLKAASGTFLNYDEALHFFVANQTSWRLAYQASPGLSHPPLLVFFLHAWRALGTSEFMLRLPSALFGTGFCWVSFRWMKNLFGREAALIGLIFLCFSPSMIVLSSEVRQYALLLFFGACALYALEQALEKNSPGWMLTFLLCLYLAILSHYSGILLAGSMGIYAIFRMTGKRPSFPVIALWAAGQIGTLGICVFLYTHYITKLGSTALQGWMGDTYLHNSYFDPHRHHLLIFIVARSVSVFQYVFAEAAVGAVAFLLFIVGIALLWKTKSTVRTQPYQMAALLVLPFAVNCVAALAGKYPYGGTRHCAFLAPFAAAGCAFALSKVSGKRTAPSLLLAVLLVAVCAIFPSHRLPYIARADQSRVHMDELLKFIQRNVGPSELIFTDEQGGMLLGHYLCQQRHVDLDKSLPGYSSFTCDAHRIVQTRVKEFYFTAENFPPRFEEMARAYGLKDDSTVWVVQAGWLWDDPLARQLQRKLPAFRNLMPHSFGNNITIFKLVVREGKLPSPD